MSRRAVLMVAWTLSVSLVAGCYYKPKTRQAKADSSFMSEAEAESLIQKKLAPYGIKFVYNMSLKRDGVSFVADGYDRDLRVGFEYRSHEGLDFEGEPNQSLDGLTDPEIDALHSRQETFREYFLVVPEGPREQIESAVEGFIKNLYAWEVLKKVKKKKSTADSLFPEKATKDSKDLLPWESTGNLKKKRKEMEAREELDGKPGKTVKADDLDGTDSADDWGKDDEDEWGAGAGEEKKGDDEDVDEEDFD